MADGSPAPELRPAASYTLNAASSAMLALDAPFRLKLTVGKLGRSSIRYDYQVFDDDEELALEGTMTVVMIQHGKPIEIPEAVAHRRSAGDLTVVSEWENAKTSLMEIEVVPATKEQEPVLANLLELYAHDFSELSDLKIGVEGRLVMSGSPLLERAWSLPVSD